MKSIVKRLTVVLAAAVVASPVLAADRPTGCKAQDDLAWPQPGHCAPALVIGGATGLPQPDTTLAIVAGGSPAIPLVTHPADGTTPELVPAAPAFHTGITRESVRLAAR